MVNLSLFFVSLWLQPGAEAEVDHGVPGSRYGGAHVRLRSTCHAGTAQFILAPRAPATPGNGTLHIRAGVRGVGLEFRSGVLSFLSSPTLSYRSFHHHLYLAKQSSTMHTPASRRLTSDCACEKKPTTTLLHPAKSSLCHSKEGGAEELNQERPATSCRYLFCIYLLPAAVRWMGAISTLGSTSACLMEPRLDLHLQFLTLVHHPDFISILLHVFQLLATGNGQVRELTILHWSQGYHTSSQNFITRAHNSPLEPRKTFVV